MRPERLLAQRLVRAAGAQARGELAPPIAAAAAHARAYQAAAEIPDGNEPGSEAQQGAEHPQQQQQWAPRRGLPPADAYGVQVTIKAHNLKFVKLASTAVRDLMLLHFAPKSRAALPPALQQPGQVPWVNLVSAGLIVGAGRQTLTAHVHAQQLGCCWAATVTARARRCCRRRRSPNTAASPRAQAMPVGDVSLPTRRSHFTVIRGPHVHKTSREQFARTTHKRLISFSTNNLSELTWFLDNLKLYQFVGAELSVRVSSSSYLLPTSSAEQDGAAAPLLAGHMRRFGRLFGGASGSRSASGSGASGSASFEALQQSLQGLQQAVRQGLVQQRAALSDTQAFQHWQQAMGPDGDDSSGTVAATAAQPARAVADAVSQQLEGSPLAAADGSSSGGGAAAAPGGGDAFLAAVDKALLGVKLDVLDRCV